MKKNICAKWKILENLKNYELISNFDFQPWSSMFFLSAQEKMGRIFRHDVFNRSRVRKQTRGSFLVCKKSLTREHDGGAWRDVQGDTSSEVNREQSHDKGDKAKEWLSEIKCGREKEEKDKHVPGEILRRMKREQDEAEKKDEEEKKKK